jgi:addiction module HigA family antidote
MGLPQKELAEHWGVDFKVVNRLCNGHTSVDMKMAMRLAATFDTSVELWLNLQRSVDEWEIKRSGFKLPKSLAQ